jgi:hypothetical protein
MGSGGGAGTESNARKLIGQLRPGHHTCTKKSAWGWMAAALLAHSAGPPVAPAQQLHYESPSRVTATRFEVDAAAHQPLQTLWENSSAAGAERVACIGGEITDGVGHISRVLLLEPGDADSLGISASASIERCSPPQWFGTAHTHIALYDGQHPYPNFSGADRGVMMLWWRRWTADGVFCVLYSSTEAHCELQSTSASLIAGPGTRVSY